MEKVESGFCTVSLKVLSRMRSYSSVLKGAGEGISCMLRGEAVMDAALPNNIAGCMVLSLMKSPSIFFCVVHPVVRAMNWSGFVRQPEG